MDKSEPSKERQISVASAKHLSEERQVEVITERIGRERDEVTNNPTDLQAALRKACEEAETELILDTNTLPSITLARLIERRLRPVVEALRDSVIEECKKVVCDISEMYEKKNEGRVRIAESHEWSAFFICLALDELKGAPR